MNVIVEAADAMGKDTQIGFIEQEFERRGKAVHIIHYSNIKLATNKDIEIASRIRYREMFNIMNFSNNLNIFIFNRAHLGETVYSPIYRGYNGDYVFEYEKKFVNKGHENTKLIVFTDDPEKSIERDIKRNDGKSFSLELEKRTNEINRFVEAYNKSVLDKKLIELKGRDANQIWQEEVYPFIFED